MSSGDSNSEINQRIERIQNHTNVQGLILVNTEGNPIRSNMDNSTSLQYTRHAEELKTMTQHVVRDLDPQDDLLVLRLRTRLNEVIILPGRCSTMYDLSVLIHPK
ncbi:unnamed protein product [Mesocestoides corti]|uniref:Robl_LC7 domain-containing protein n=1 Tax=Mesocestoides corti TaxID=53468 RepID=A0A0R3U4G3_MESCO|nr:unnamed protein product [Mesocestoides corti]